MVDEPNKDNGTLDSFLEGLELSIKPISPEHALMIRLTGGTGYKEIHSFRYWLRHELSCYYDLIDAGFDIVKNSFDKNTGLVHRVKASKEDWIKLRTKYYIHMKFQSWIEWDVSGLGKLDVDKAAEEMLKHEDVVQVVSTKKEDLPRN